MNKLELIRLGSKYRITKEYDEYKVHHVESGLFAYIDSKNKIIEYYVAADIQKTPSRQAEIEIEELKELENFCKLMLEEE